MDKRPTAIDAGNAFLALLSDDQRTATCVTIESWHTANRDQHGIDVSALNTDQRSALYDLLASSLSVTGLAKTIARVGLGKTSENLPAGAEDDDYRVALLGTPSATEAWGWQLKGPHLDLPCVMTGDHLSITPHFIAAEPIIESETSDLDTDVSAMVPERDKGMALVIALTDAQRATARINATDSQFADVGIRASDLTQEQQIVLLDLIAEYVNTMQAESAAITMSEVEAQLDETTFAYIDDTDDEPVFYYRVHNPALTIEFDYQEPGPLGHATNYHQSIFEPQRAHIHAVVRTPNDADADRDILTQHYMTSSEHVGTPSAATASISGSLVIGGQIVPRPMLVLRSRDSPSNAARPLQPTKRFSPIATLERGLEEVTGWPTMRDATSGWVDLICPDEQTAMWLWYAIATENIDVRQHHNLLFFATGPAATARDSITHVINAVAKSHRCWSEHQRFTLRTLGNISILSVA